MLIIKTHYLIDGVSNKVKHKQALLIEKGKIVEIRPLNENNLPAGARIMNITRVAHYLGSLIAMCTSPLWAPPMPASSKTIRKPPGR